MKSLLLSAALAIFTLTASAQGGDKSKRPSPPAKASQTLESGAVISIDYSQPSVKGRTIGKDLEPTAGKVWRTGANEATTFTVNRDVKIEGQELKAGKYTMFTIPGEDEWTLIFNKQTGQWGTRYDEAQDALRVKVKPTKAPSFTEKMTFTQTDGGINLMWGDTAVRFGVQ